MFNCFKRKINVDPEQIPQIELPLENIREIDQAGILYIDIDGNSANILYHDAYKGWCKSKSIKKSEDKYICDRIKTEGRRKLIFYTNPNITFNADVNQEDLWFRVLNRIRLQGYYSFDCD